jgi:hypothetical protein
MLDTGFGMGEIFLRTKAQVRYENRNNNTEHQTLNAEL